MKDSAASRLLSRYLAFGLPVLYFLTSVSFYLRTYDSAQVKITLVQMFGALLMGFWYLAIASEPQIPWTSYALIALPLVASLESGLLSFSHAAYRGPSLDECLRRVFYIHFALIALREINTIQRLKRVLMYLLAATAITVGYGTLQFLDATFYQAPQPGIDPFVWRRPSARASFRRSEIRTFLGISWSLSCRSCWLC